MSELASQHHLVGSSPCPEMIGLDEIDHKLIGQIDELLIRYGMRGFGRIVGRGTVLCTPMEVFAVGAIAKASNEDGWLNCIAVQRHYRRRGYGAMVVRELLKGAPSNVWLETMFWNKAFYESLGFKHVPVLTARRYFGRDPRRKTNTMVMWRPSK